MQGRPGGRDAMTATLADAQQPQLEVPGIAPELFVGICTLLLATAVWLWVRQRRQQQRVEALVRVRTRELAVAHRRLAASEARARAFFDLGLVGLAELGADTGILRCNGEFATMLASCRKCGVKFYLDLPLGVNPDGYDVWANQQLFANGASVGAPPDAFFTRGQDWGFPPLNPQTIRHQGYRYVIDYLRFQMRHTGVLRLDHVMGLHRLWWVPRGAGAADGAYVSYNAEELYAILCLESHRHQTVLVGENLGTVPPEVNRSMKRHGLRTMYVAQYEMQPNARRPLRDPPRDCVASINTHDMPMWAAHWKGLDIADRQRLGLLRPKEAREERKRRAKLRQALAGYLRRKKLLTAKPNAQNVFAALVKFLCRSEAELVLVNLEDLWLETEPQNTPGTSSERVNWQRKARLSLEETFSRRDVTALLTELSKR